MSAPVSDKGAVLNGIVADDGSVLVADFGDGRGMLDDGSVVFGLDSAPVLMVNIRTSG